MSLADRQSAASRQGDEWERTVATWLKIRGYTILRMHWREPVSRVEIDIVASRTPLLDDDDTWVECCGSWESPTANGLERSDSVLKKIGSAAVLGTLLTRRPYWLVVSHLPRPGSAPETWLAAARRLFDRIECLGEQP